MNKFIATLFLVALVLSSVEAKKHHKKAKHQEKPDYSKYTEEQTRNAFAQLKTSEAGLEIFTTIQLEMTSGNGDWIDTSLELLEDLSKSTQAKISDLNGNLNKRRNYCDEKIDEIKPPSIVQKSKSAKILPAFQC